MTIRHLKIFVAVCEHGGVTRAAEALHMAQPAVSHTVSDLEKYYKVTLFDRINQRMVLTDMGRQLLSKAKELVAEFENFEALATLGSADPRVRIGATLTLGQTLIPKFLQKLAAERPDIQPEAVIRPSAALQSEIESGNVDFAILEGEVSSPYLRTEAFRRDRLVAVAHTAFSCPDSLTVEELAGYPLLLREYGSASREFFEKALAEKSIRCRPLMDSANNQALITAVYASLGIAFLPASFVRGHIQRGKFKEIAIRDLDCNRVSYLVIHKNKKLNAIQNEVYGLLRDFCE